MNERVWMVWLIPNKDMSPMSKILYALIDTLVQPCNTQYIADRVGATPKCVGRALKELRQSGLVTRTRVGRLTWYCCQDPKGHLVERLRKGE